MSSQNEKYVVVGDFASPFGYLVDWERYKAVPWWRRFFLRNNCIVASGSRAELRELAAKANADSASARKLIAEFNEREEVQEACRRAR